ncbi:MAG: hypothetical protein EON56_05380, partial [Alphaproteobacteria bacterium]
MIAQILKFLQSKLAVTAVSALGSVALYSSEDDIASAAFATAVTAVVVSMIFLPTRRLAVSTYSGWAITVIIVGCSSVKAHMAGMSLHVFDILFVAADPLALSFLVQTYLSYAIGMFVFLSVAAVALLLLWRHEQPTPL